MVRHILIEHLRKILGKFGVNDMDVQVETPADFSYGDYSSNIALVASKKLKQNPIALAEKIKERLEVSSKKLGVIQKIEVAKPGFINFWLSKEYLTEELEKLLQQENVVLGGRKNQKILVEFAHPNTHKEFHIGHLRNITVGEVICRLLEADSANVKRVNYQGDVGLHVAKALYGLLRNSKFEIRNSKLTLEEKAKLLGQAYAYGSKAYEEDLKAKEEILKINKQIYARDPAIIDLWRETRQWSLDYFEAIYKRLGMTFERLYFESEVYESGKAIVLAHIADGIFTKDDGAVIFDGEKFGLHKRVFITSEGNATYEGKEMGLGPLQYKEFPFDRAIHVVGPEQAGYFNVVFRALELVYPQLSGKEMHLPYGLVGLKEGKMSSRTGKVIAGLWLLDEAKRLLKKQFPDMSDEVLEQVATGAVKYSMLRFGLSQHINFSFEESISLEGNSGPYLQYTHARTRSILAKLETRNSKLETNTKFKIQNSKLLITNYELQSEELNLLRALHRFAEIVAEAAEHFAPNLLCNYLFDLAQKFNLFYQKHRILGGKPLKQHDGTVQFRLALTAGVGKTLKQGLYLLGIAAPGRM